MSSNEEEASNYSFGKIQEYYDDQNYGRAFAHFILWLELNPEKREDVEDSFTHITEMRCMELDALSQRRHVLFSFNQALRYYPHNLRLLTALATYFLRHENYHSAITYLRYAHENHPEDLKCEKDLESLYAKVVPQWHFRMLNDQLRNTKYKAAIYSILRNFHREKLINVVDIGTGTGLLSLYVDKYRKERDNMKKHKIHVVAIEESQIMANIAQDNFLKNRILDFKIINKMSTNVDDQNYNLLITEIFDCCLFGEGALATLIHAHQKLLVQNTPSVILPYSARLFMFGIESEEIDGKFRFKHANLESLPFKTPKCIKRKHEDPYDALSINLYKYKQLTNVHEICHVNFNDLQQLIEIFTHEAAFDPVYLHALREGACHAFVICFELNLDQQGKFTLSTNPLTIKDLCVCWEQGIVFTEHPMHLKQGDMIQLKVDSTADKLTVLVEDLFRFENEQHIKSIDNETDRCDCCNVSSEALTHLNFKELHNVYENVKQEEQDGANDKKSVAILELSSLPLFSITFSKNTTRKVCADLVLSESNLETAKKLLELNEIQENQYDIISGDNDQVLGETEKLEKYDFIVFDPVLENGLLNESFFSNIDSYKSLLSATGVFMPMEVTLCFELVESFYFQNCTTVISYDKDMIKVASSINPYSVQEMRSLSGDFTRRSLSDVIKVPIFYDEESHVQKCSFKITDRRGILHGFLYWFELKYNGKIVSTRDSSYNLAAFVLPDRMDVKMPKKVEVRQQGGLLKIVACLQDD